MRVKARTGLLEEMTWPEVKAVADAGLPAVLALGSTEQHGPQLPLSTDSVIPVGIAQRAAESYPLVVAPPIHYGMKSRPLSGGGEGFPGTISLEIETVLHTVEQVISGLFRSGFKKICIQGFHLENGAIAWSAADRAAEKNPGVDIVVLESPMPSLNEKTIKDLFGEDFRGWQFEHAALLETSLMMALRPELVREDRIVDDAAERVPEWDRVPAPEEYIPRSGVLSNTRGSSAELGERLLEIASGHLCAALTAEFGESRMR